MYANVGYTPRLCGASEIAGSAVAFQWRSTVKLSSAKALIRVLKLLFCPLK
jgi:hypothetical protein